MTARDGDGDSDRDGKTEGRRETETKVDTEIVRSREPENHVFGSPKVPAKRSYYQLQLINRIINRIIGHIICNYQE